MQDIPHFVRGFAESPQLRHLKLQMLKTDAQDLGWGTVGFVEACMRSLGQASKHLYVQIEDKNHDTYLNR